MALIAIPIVVAGIVLAVLLMAYVYSMYYIKSPPDVVTILTGRKTYRIIRGGAALRIPVVERVDVMSIAPFELPVEVKNAYSKEGVPVNVEATALVRFNSAEAAIKTAAERFLNSDRAVLKDTVLEIISGHMRSICAKMTVEELNGNREILVSQVTSEAGTDFGRIGMELDVLTIKHITDEVGYLDALGRKRTAEVVRDAEIGEADAKRDSQIRSAAARQAGATAEAEAMAAIAEAERDRDVRVAQASAAVEAERRKAEQAGPLAEAQAKEKVVEAEVAIEETRERANIAVEEQRITKEEKSQHAEIVVPAEARRQAEIAVSEGERQAAINRAEGQKEKLAREGQGQANARSALADATQRELEAQAAGTEAQLLAEAKGKDELAKALNAYREAGLQLEIVPQFIKELPNVFAAIASSFNNVERIVMVDSGSGNGSGPVERFVGHIPAMFAGGIETMRAVGIDFGSMLGMSEGPPSTQAAPAAGDGPVDAGDQQEEAEAGE